MVKGSYNVWEAMAAHQKETGRNPDLKHVMVPSVLKNTKANGAEKDEKTE